MFFEPFVACAKKMSTSLPLADFLLLSIGLLEDEEFVETNNNITNNNAPAPAEDAVPNTNPAPSVYVGPVISNLSYREQLQMIYNQNRQIYNQQVQIMRMLKEQDKNRNSEYLKVNRNINRIAIQPARRIGRGNPNPIIANDNVNIPQQQQHQQHQQHQQQQQQQQQQAPTYTGPPAGLSKVKNLYELWHEFEFGMGGNKAAKYFTAQERGTVKHKYTRRKVFWDCIIQQVNRGISYNVAIDRVYQVYGQEKSVTKIINEMRTDKKNNNLHVSLA